MANVQLSVFGIISEVSFNKAKCCAEDLHERNVIHTKPTIVGMVEFEWDLYLEEKKKELRGEMWSFDDKAVVFVDDVVVGGPLEFLLWAEQHHQYADYRPHALHVTLTEQAYTTFLTSKQLDTQHEYVYMDITIGTRPVGRLVIELFTDKVPRTCVNFLRLCMGMGISKLSGYPLDYSGSIFHRIVPHGWIQGGDLWLKKGDGGESIYGETFDDENFSVSHHRRGIVGMANKGKHSNGSQFYITLKPAKWMDTKFVAFGQVIEGMKTLKEMEVEETMNERPINQITIAHAGQCLYKF